MKAILGPEDMIFNTASVKIVEETLNIVSKYQEDMSTLGAWLASEKARIKSEYERRHAQIISNTEKALVQASKVNK